VFSTGMQHFASSLSQKITWACMLEAIAPKPGNVHRGADFEDLHFVDFMTSATIVGSVVTDRIGYATGRIILECVQKTQMTVRTNTNLGIVLLLIPLAKAANLNDVTVSNLTKVLNDLNQDDARDIYQAIRTAQSSALGTQERHDINEAPPECVMVAMHTAKDRDMIAKQYCNGFADILNVIAPYLKDLISGGHSAIEAIVVAHLFTMSQFPDSLIARKSGADVAKQSQTRASQLIETVQGRGLAQAESEIAEFDFWLRSDGTKRNPGTSADLVCAAVFVGLVEGWIQPPFRNQQEDSNTEN